MMHYENELINFLETYKDTSVLSEILNRLDFNRKEAAIFAIIHQQGERFLSSVLTSDELTQYKNNMETYYVDKNQSHHDFIAFHELTHQFYLNNYIKKQHKQPNIAEDIVINQPQPVIRDNAIIDSYSLKNFQSPLYYSKDPQPPLVNLDTKEVVRYQNMAEETVANILRLREQEKNKETSTLEHKPK